MALYTESLQKFAPHPEPETMVPHSEAFESEQSQNDGKQQNQAELADFASDM